MLVPGACRQTVRETTVSDDIVYCGLEEARVGTKAALGRHLRERGGEIADGTSFLKH